MNGLRRVRNRQGDALSRVDWRRFEVLLADYYRANGYRVEHVGTGATDARFDGGIDLKLRRDDEYIVVQCKHWNAYQVPHNDLHQLIGIMVNQRATGAIFVTSGEFTDAAKRAARRLEQVQLIDGVELRRMIGELPFAATDAIAEVAPEVHADRGGRRRADAMARVRETPQFDAHEPLMRTAIALVALFVLGLALRAVFGALSPPHTAMTAAHPRIVATAPAPALRPRSTLADAAIVAMPPAPATPTVAERREAEREAAEAARILERSTPEL